MAEAFTPQEYLNLLVKFDDELTDAYIASKSSATRSAIAQCRSRLAAVMDEIIRQDLHRRTDRITKLTQELKGATDTLEGFAKAVRRVAEALKIVAAVVDTARKVAALL